MNCTKFYNKIRCSKEIIGGFKNGIVGQAYMFIFPCFPAINILQVIRPYGRTYIVLPIFDFMVPVLSSIAQQLSGSTNFFLVAFATSILAMKYLLSQSKQQPLEISLKMNFEWCHSLCQVIQDK